MDNDLTPNEETQIKKDTMKGVFGVCVGFDSRADVITWFAPPVNEPSCCFKEKIFREDRASTFVTSDIQLAPQL